MRQLRPSRMRRHREALIGCMALALAAPFSSGFAADCVGVSPVSGTELTSIVVAANVDGGPLEVASPPGDLDRLFIMSQSGLLWIKHRGDPPASLAVFLDIRSKVQSMHNEMGLLGIAFDPGYAINGRFYISYTEGPFEGPIFRVVARYTVTPGNPDLADPNSEQRLLRLLQPEPNHVGGQILFGADGFLYVTTGDGGGGGDNHGICGNGQNLSVPYGKILRLDVRGVDPNSLAPDCGGITAAYRIPVTNPFADGPGGECDEIWSYGLRNPWRSSFDAATGDIYIGDVGQSCTEEIDFSAGGGTGLNYGWRQVAGSRCFETSFSTCDPDPIDCPGVPPCFDPSLVLPVLDYLHTGTECAVTGGYVYRGCLMPDLVGRYFYGDFCAGFVRSFVMSGGVATDHQDHTPSLAPAGELLFSLAGFGVDDQGEMYIADRDGTVFRILPAFTNMEVSGPGAASQFLTGATWTWEDLEFSTMHPVTSYRVYRGTPGGDFQCIFSSPASAWPGGDSLNPPVSGLFAYLVTAVNPSGQLARSGSPASTLLPSPCP